MSEEPLPDLWDEEACAAWITKQCQGELAKDVGS